MPRNLRIAVSVFFGLLTVLLVSLLVRSIATVDAIAIPLPGQNSIVLLSSQRELELVAHRISDPSEIDLQRMKLGRIAESFQPLPPKFSWEKSSTKLRVTTPIRFWEALAAALFAMPWILARYPLPKRFSLLTLFVATTLFAVVLGMSVWLAS